MTEKTEAGDASILDFGNPEPEGDPTTEADVVGKALVTVRYGRGYALLFQGGYALKQLLDDVGCTGESFPIDALDYNTPDDGIYICDVKIVDDGPGDWPGSREAIPQLLNFRLATPEEWLAFIDGDWPWESFASTES